MNWDETFNGFRIETNKTTSPRFQRGTPPFKGGELIPVL